MEILHFKDFFWGVYRVSFGCEYNCLSAQCQISIAANMIRGINPHIKLHCNVFGIDNVMPLKVIAVGHTHRQTADNLNIIVF